MGSGYSDLILYFKCKDENNQASKNGETDKYTIKTSKQSYEVCSNFERVTHTIEFKPPENGTYYNVLLYNGDKDDKSDYIFGYYYPDKSKVLKEVHVYYSVLAPDNPLVISFVIQNDHIYNCTYNTLKSTGWCKAYNITYYSLNHLLSTEDLTNEFKKLKFNRKIKFVVGNDSKDVSGTEQKIGKNENYRYVFTPKGEKSVLGSKCLFKLNSNGPKCSENNKPEAQTQASGNGQNSNASNYENEIDKYYLDSVKGQFFDGIMVYFAKENTSNSNASIQNGKNGANQNGSNHAQNGKKNKDDMAVLLEFVDSCSTKKFLKRKDKNGYWWAEEEVEYTDDTKFDEHLKEIQKKANENVMTTFVLEKKDSFTGVTIKPDDKKYTTYTKYTHSATATNKPNLLFRKEEVNEINDKVKDIKTKTLDVYFLKVKGKEEEEYPFLLFFNEKDNKQQQQQQQQQQQPPQALQQQQVSDATSSNISTSPKDNNEKCYFFKNTYKFDDWQELKVDKAPEKKEEKEKQGKQEQKEEKTLDKKLEEKLDKIEKYGKCATELCHLRTIAYYILIGDEEKAKETPPVTTTKTRPDLLPFPKVSGPGVVQILGYVAAGLVVSGVMGGGLYGIYWYNTTIKLLT